jgi:hypothetical protein
LQKNRNQKKGYIMKDGCLKLLKKFVPLALLLPMFAHAALPFVGPLDPANGFPRWYKDSRGVRLALCLEQNTFCLPLEDTDPNLPVSFPDNFPGEAFWWHAEATLDNVEGGEVRLVLALEAAFAREIPQAGDRISFARVRIRARGIPLGTYRVTHPYGQSTFEATETDGRQINETNDVGITNEIFTGALAGDIGPFLVWDPSFAPAAPAGYIGDPTVPHRVIGSPRGTNFLRIERLINGRFRTVGFTNLFNVAGKLDTLPEEPILNISPKGGIYTTSPIVNITSSIPSTIYYTLDGSDPLTSSTRLTYNGPFRLPDCAALKFAAQTSNARSEVGTEIYIKVP